MYLIDTSVLIEIMKATELGAKLLLDIGDLPVAISAVTRYEYLTYFKGNKLEEEKNILRNLPVHDVDSECADKASEIQGQLKSKGVMINDRDIFIASTCLNKGLVLVTLDKHFKNVTGLNVKKIDAD